MWGGRAIVPEKMRPDVLKLLHDTHIGNFSYEEPC